MQYDHQLGRITLFLRFSRCKHLSCLLTSGKKSPCAQHARTHGEALNEVMGQSLVKRSSALCLGSVVRAGSVTK